MCQCKYLKEYLKEYLDIVEEGDVPVHAENFFLSPLSRADVGFLNLFHKMFLFILVQY